MALKVPTAQEAGDKLAARAGAASGDYATKAKAAGDAWQAGAVAAKGAFQQGISAGNIAERFARGVAKAGAAKYVRKITDVGAGRFAAGVQAGKQDYIANVGDFLSTLAGLTLSPRQPRGSAANITRVSEVAMALNAKRLSMLGG